MKKDIHSLFNNAGRYEANKVPFSVNELRSKIENRNQIQLQKRFSDLFKFNWRKTMFTISSLLIGLFLSAQLFFSASSDEFSNIDNNKSTVKLSSTTAKPTEKREQIKSIQEHKDNLIAGNTPSIGEKKDEDEIISKTKLKKASEFEWNEVIYDPTDNAFKGHQIYERKRQKSASRPNRERSQTGF